MIKELKATVYKVECGRCDSGRVEYLISIDKNFGALYICDYCGSYSNASEAQDIGGINIEVLNDRLCGLSFRVDDEEDIPAHMKIIALTLERQ